MTILHVVKARDEIKDYLFDEITVGGGALVVTSPAATSVEIQRILKIYGFTDILTGAIVTVKSDANVLFKFGEVFGSFPLDVDGAFQTNPGEDLIIEIDSSTVKCSISAAIVRT